MRCISASLECFTWGGACITPLCGSLPVESKSCQWAKCFCKAYKEAQQNFKPVNKCLPGPQKLKAIVRLRFHETTITSILAMPYDLGRVETLKLSSIGPLSIYIMGTGSLMLITLSFLGKACFTQLSIGYRS
ncbi:hypothetical protein BT63DRAFT_166403 [Microthyrium microscopicum]|uniref:Uncharacterized protein n=1 Tax=Microthyrium microscopicum TaxID=703497 RepID=A0A6A6URS0_9PEZI|nr:hypothetical protein BT63DRAFT_166403 [Microthyrium microscopicum]